MVMGSFFRSLLGVFRNTFPCGVCPDSFFLDGRRETAVRTARLVTKSNIYNTLTQVVRTVENVVVRCPSALISFSARAVTDSELVS